MIAQIKATAAAEWIVRVCAPAWLKLIDMEYAEPILEIDDIMQLLPHLQRLGETAHATHGLWESSVHTSGLAARDAARAASSTAIWASGWPEMARLAWSYEWKDKRLEAWQYAWNATKVSVRHASWSAARASGIPVAANANIDNEAWKAAFAASQATLRPTSLELRRSSATLLKRLNIKSVEV